MSLLPSPSPEVGGATTRTALPYRAVLGLVTGWTLFDLSRGPLRDVDLYWHLLIGGQIWADPSTLREGLGGWEILPQSTEWASTQWLSEIVLYLLHSVGNWPALAVFRVVTTGVVIAVLAATTLRGRPAALAGWPYVLTVLMLGVSSQERSQQFTYIGAAALSGVLVPGLREGRVPRWWIVLPATAIWANLHGGWVLVPAVLALLGLGRALDQGLSDAATRRFWGLAVVSLAAGAVAPGGITNVTAVLRFSEAAAPFVIEWQPTEPFSRGGYVSLLMLLLVMVSWSRARRVAPSEVLATCALLVLAWTSWRNLAPAMILLTPLAAAQLVSAFPSLGRHREPRWSASVGVAAAAGLALVGLATIPGRDHLPMEKYPIGLASTLSNSSEEVRVLNEYNAAGVTLYFGGDGVRVGIDGRTDYWGAEYIEAYLAMMNLRGNWEELLAELDPDAALIRKDLALTHVLVEEQGWIVAGREREYVLLLPGSPRSQSSAAQ